MGVQDRRDAMEALKGVEAIFFDVFGTVVDWQGGVSQELNRHYEGLLGIDWIAFAREWRAGYFATTRRIAEGGTGSMNVDVVHREILDSMLASPRWEHLGLLWDEEKRRDLTLAWHRLSGWPDSKEGLYAIKKQAIITTLSNGSVKLLVDMAKFADLPWDVIFCSELFGSYKPNPIVYQTAIKHLALAPHQCAMVASHIYDVRAAATLGIKTVYIRRPTEDEGVRDEIKSKAEGGDMDVVVTSFIELAEILKARGGGG